MWEFQQKVQQCCQGFLLRVWSSVYEDDVSHLNDALSSVEQNSLWREEQALLSALIRIDRKICR